nr:hypothetical protein BaRGS_026901 [Batillaria attramentaria]
MMVNSTDAVAKEIKLRNTKDTLAFVDNQSDDGQKMENLPEMIEMFLAWKIRQEKRPLKRFRIVIQRIDLASGKPNFGRFYPEIRKFDGYCVDFLVGLTVEGLQLGRKVS